MLCPTPMLQSDGPRLAILESVVWSGAIRAGVCNAHEARITHFRSPFFVIVQVAKFLSNVLVTGASDLLLFRGMLIF